MHDHNQCCHGPQPDAAASDTPAAPDRRAFLKTASLGVGALTVGLVSVLAAAPPPRAA